MKKLLVLIFCLSTTFLWGQKKDLPAVVMDSLMHKYPDAQEIKSKKQKDLFRIRFDNHGIKTTSTYDVEGNWVETESILKEKDLPEKVKNPVRKKYPGGIISIASLKENNSGLFVYYIQVDTEKFIINLEMDRNGKITKSEQVKKELPSPSREQGSDSGGDE